MAKLTARDRANLPDRAFAYVDSNGKRRLPINDEPHVKNALARFERVKFESDEARDTARKRLLRAAKKYGIVPVGFMTSQLEAERIQGQLDAGGVDFSSLPEGVITLVFTDIERSTALLRRLGDRYPTLLQLVREIVRSSTLEVGGHVVEFRADETFTVFEDPAAAINAAVEIQTVIQRTGWPDQVDLRLRIGIHTGKATIADTGYVGLAVNTAARVCSAGHGGQIIVTTETGAAGSDATAPGATLRSIGEHALAGLPEPTALFQVEADGLLTNFPPLRTGTSVDGE